MTTFERETLADGWTWWRIADADWDNPLDPDFARRRGGRWNPPDSFPTLYLNEDLVSSRLNLRAFIAQWPYEPEDLRAETGPVLVAAKLPRHQEVADIHTPKGAKAAGLPKTYPFEKRGKRVPHSRCQLVGQAVKVEGLKGIRTRSAQAPDGAGRELAWFPATKRSAATQVNCLSFDEWYWS